MWCRTIIKQELVRSTHLDKSAVFDELLRVELATPEPGRANLLALPGALSCIQRFRFDREASRNFWQGHLDANHFSKSE